MKKILMLVGDFVEDYEVMVPYQALQIRNMSWRTNTHGSGCCEI